MQVFKGSPKTGTLEPTDSVLLTDELLADWNPSTILKLDGTKDKSGNRKTQIGVRFSTADIAALGKALLRYNNEQIAELKVRRAKEREATQTLEKALRLISSLAGNGASDTPRKLLQNIEKIAEHYRRSWTRNTPLQITGVDIAA